MIAPVFFPFTHISPYQEKTVLTVFKTISFFPIMSASELNTKIKRTDSIQGVIPVLKETGFMKPVIQKADEYIQWAALNRGNEKNLKTLLKAYPYFKSDTGVFALKSQVMKNAAAGSRTEDPDAGPGSLFQAMLFLRIAQFLDRDKQIIRERFASLQQTESSILAALKGDPETDPTFSQDDGLESDDENDPGNYLTAKRVDAWLTFWNDNNHSELFKKHPVFVTTSETAFDYLVSFNEKNINALDIDNIKVHENNCAEKNRWQDDFLRFVQNALEKGSGQSGRIIKADDGCVANVRIRLYFLSKGDAVNNILHRTYETIPVCLVQVNKKNT